MEEKQSEIRSLSRELKAVSAKVDSMAEEIKDIPKELKQVKADIKILKESQTKEWLDGHEVTIALSISPRTLQYMRNSGQLPFSQFHNKRFYKVSDVNAILETNYLTHHPIKNHDH